MQFLLVIQMNALRNFLSWAEFQVHGSSTQLQTYSSYGYCLKDKTFSYVVLPITKAPTEFINKTKP